MKLFEYLASNPDPHTVEKLAQVTGANAKFLGIGPKIHRIACNDLIQLLAGYYTISPPSECSKKPA